MLKCLREIDSDQSIKSYKSIGNFESDKLKTFSISKKIRYPIIWNITNIKENI